MVIFYYPSFNLDNHIIYNLFESKMLWDNNLSMTEKIKRE